MIASVLVDQDHWAITTKRTIGNSTTESDLTLVIAVAAVGAGFVLVGVFLHRISEVSLPGGVGVKLGEWTSDAEAAARQAGADEVSEEQIADAETLLGLRLALEHKMTWIAKHFGISETETVGYLTIGSLRYDGYLTDEQARTATRLLTASEQAIALSSKEDREAFLAASKTLVSSVRATALFERTRHQLESLGKDRADWDLAELVWKRGRRPDLQLTRAAQKTLRLATVFPYGKDNPYDEARKRLAPAAAEGDAWIVIPRRLPRPLDLRKINEGKSVPVVYLDALTAKLIGDA